MRGTPDIKFKTKSLTSISTDKWFYYCLKDNWETDNDIWSSTWSTVDGLNPFHYGGIYHFFTQDCYYESHRMNDILKYSDEHANFLCTYEDGVKYCDNFAEKYNLKRGDIVQIDYDGSGVQYDHSLYVWCTEPEIRFCSNSSDYFGKRFSDIHAVYEKAIYRIIHTTDHAVSKSAW